MKLNNKGLAISSVIFSILILFLLISFSLLALLGTRKMSLDKLKSEVLNEIQGSSYDKLYEFAYTGDYQTFIAPVAGNYRFEAWGASGGDASEIDGGFGSYNSGDIYLSKGQTIYVYVGQSATLDQRNVVMYNSGSEGSDFTSSFGYKTTASGGATDFRLISGEWDNFNSLSSRILVSSGGGGTAVYHGNMAGADGGGLIGYSGLYSTYGSSLGIISSLNHSSTQTSGGPINKDAISGTVESHIGNFGVGNSRSAGGYFASPIYEASNTVYSSFGASSFISGHTGAVAIKSESDQSPKDIGFEVRYIEIGSNGSSLNTGNHIVEVQAFTNDGTNVALGKPVTSNVTENSTLPFLRVTDGETNSDIFSSVGTVTTVDLQYGYDLSSIKLWRFHKDARTYKNTYVKLYNEDKTQWVYLHDYEIDGTYAESSAGNTLTVGCTTGTNDNSCSVHYSDLSFTNTSMIDGSGYAWTNTKQSYLTMLSPSGVEYPLGEGHSGNGFARITLLD